MKILVTGGAGFIGHNVVIELEKAGHQCLIIDSSTTYGVIPLEELSDLFRERFNLFKTPIWNLDLGKRDSFIEKIIDGFQPEVIIHLAGPPRQSVVEHDPRTASEIMIGGTISLLEFASKYKARRFVYISSSMVYGDFRQDVYEDSPTHPINQYGILKLTGEELVRNHARKTGLQYNIVRPSAVYGERDIKDRVVNKFFLSALRGEPIEVRGADERLDFTYVKDAAHGIVLAALNTERFNRIYNITRSRARTLLEAAELVVKIVGKGEIKVVDKDQDSPSRGALDISQATRDLGYIPTTDIEDGFQKCYEWIKNTIR